jgi:peroxiredoxin
MSKNLEPGAMFPDFELPDDTGTMHRLSEIQGDNAMVVLLARGEHCPRERQHHTEMLRFHKLAPVAFTELVSIFPNDQHDTNKMKIATGAFWTFLSDENLEVHEAFDIQEYTDEHHAQATVPHTVVLKPGSLEIDKVYVGYWFWGRPSPEQLWADLQDVFRRTKADYDPTVPEARAAWDESRAGAAAAS